MVFDKYYVVYDIDDNMVFDFVDKQWRTVEEYYESDVNNIKFLISLPVDSEKDRKEALQRWILDDLDFISQPEKIKIKFYNDVIVLFEIEILGANDYKIDFNRMYRILGNI